MTLMYIKHVILQITVLAVIGAPCFGANDELSKIKSQIKQTELQHQKIEQQIKSSNKDVEQTKKQLVKTADRVSTLEERNVHDGSGAHECPPCKCPNESGRQGNRRRVDDGVHAIRRRKENYVRKGNWLHTV